MSGIIPDANAGGLPVRDENGNPIVQPSVFNAYIPPASFATSCTLRYLPSDCSARITAAQINAFQSELICLAESLNPDGGWQCDDRCNLATAFANWVSGDLPELALSAICSADEGEFTSSMRILACGPSGPVKVTRESLIGEIEIDDVTGLEGALDGKAPVVHSHEIDDINELRDALYTHPTGDGWEHVPANGTVNGGRVLQATAAPGGTKWATPVEILANYATTSGAGTALVVTLDPAPTELRAGMSIFVRMVSADGGQTTTLNLNGFGAYLIRVGKIPSTVAQTRRWEANSVVHLVFDGTYWLIVNIEPVATETLFGRVRLATAVEAYSGSVMPTGDAVITPKHLTHAIIRGQFLYWEDTSTVANKLSINVKGPSVGEGGWMVAGCSFFVKVANTNTGPAQLAPVTGSVYRDIVKRDGSQLVAGDLLAGEIIHVVYNGQYWQLMGR